MTTPATITPDHSFEVDLEDLIRTEEAAIALERADAATLRAMLSRREAELEAARAKLAEERAAHAEQANRLRDLEIATLIRDGRAEGKITLATVEVWREEAAENLDRARRRLAASPVLIHRDAPEPVGTRTAPLWEDLTVSQKIEMQEKDPETLRLLLAEYRARHPRRREEP